MINIYLNLKKPKRGNQSLPLFMLLLTLTLFSGTAYAQNVIITGTVSSVDDNMGLPMATVLVKGTPKSVSTDMDGKFSIEADAKDTLVFSYVGYTSQEIVVGTQKTINVSLASFVTELGDVVVVGYGTQKKEQVTSSVVSVQAKDFNKGSVQDVGQLIQGKVAGLTISLNSGDPTANTQVLLRGSSTLIGGNANPLVMIDGVPVSYTHLTLPTKA